MTFANQSTSGPSNDCGHAPPNPGAQRLRRRYRRHLQEHSNSTYTNNTQNDNTGNEIPTLPSVPTRDGTTRAPTVTDHEEPISSLLYRTFVSLQWSMIRFPDGESQSPTTQIMANWLLQEFLCNQYDDGVWMANSMDLLKNACSSSSLGDDPVDVETLFDTYSIIVWNEPIIDWYSEVLGNSEDVHYEVWDAQYPLFVNWNNTGTAKEPSMEDVSTQLRSAQFQLQNMLDDQIRMGELQSDRGIPSIVGRELETYWLLRSSSSETPNLPPLDVLQQPPLGHAPLEMTGTLGPYDSDLIVIIGALIALLHTLLLVFLHLILRPCLRERNEKETQRKLMAQEQERQAEITDQSEDDHMRSLLAPNYLINGQPQQQPPPKVKHRPHVLVAPNLSLSPQMSDDDLLSLNYLSALDSNSSKRSFFSTEEEDIEVVSLLSSTTQDMEGVSLVSSSSQQWKQITTKTSLMDPPGQPSCPKPFLDPPASSSASSKKQQHSDVENTNLLAPMASYFGDSDNNSHDNNDQISNVDEDSIMVLSC